MHDWGAWPFSNVSRPDERNTFIDRRRRQFKNGPDVTGGDRSTITGTITTITAGIIITITIIIITTVPIIIDIIIIAPIITGTTIL